MQVKKHYLPGMLTKEIRISILNDVESKPKKFTVKELADNYQLTEKQIRSLISRYKKKHLIKEEMQARLPTINKTKVGDIMQRVRKKRNKYKVIKDGYVEYRGDWTSVDIMIDAEGNQIDFINQTEPDIFDDDIENFTPLKAKVKLK